MTDSQYPTVEEVKHRLEELAVRVANSSIPIDPYVMRTVKRVSEELQLMIPGFEPVADLDTVQICIEEASAALYGENTVGALAKSFDGLAMAPHNPQLWYIVAICCYDLGAPLLSWIAANHALWIHPGFHEACGFLDRLVKLD